MLNAILGGKSASVLDEKGVPAAVSDILRTREDARTSSIFERLSYLPGAVAWALLRRACGGTLPAYRLAKLESIAFWPNWSMGREDRHHAQPDIYIKWSLGDPRVTVEMIVEAKLPWTGQWEDQWRDQLHAYRNHILGLAPGLEPSDEANLPDSLIYLCVDGLGRNPAEEIARRKAISGLPSDLPPLTFSACSWQTLAEALGEMALRGEIADVPIALIADLRSALAFLGHVHFSMPNALLELKLLSEPSSGLATLQKWNFNEH